MATIDGKFQKITQKMIDQSQGSSKGLRNLQGVPVENFGLPKLTQDQIHDLFLRAGLEQAYQQVIDTTIKGKLQDGFAIKMQSDFLSRCERDFKLRKLPRIRSIMMQAARRDGHGHADGVINKVIVDQPKKMLQREDKALGSGS